MSPSTLKWAAESLTLKPDGEAEYVKLRTEMSAVCSVHATRLEELVGTHADTAGIDIEVQVQLILTEPHYNTGRLLENTYLDHESPSRERM